MTISVFLVMTAVIIAALTALVWFKTKAFSFVIGIFFIYYWSLSGAFMIVGDRDGTEKTPGYYYYEKLLFPIDISKLYYTSLIYYFIFTTIIILIILVFSNTNKNSYSEKTNFGSPFKLDHGKILFASTAFLTLTILLGYDVFLNSFREGISAYAYFYGSEEEQSSLWLLTNMIALSLAALGTAIAASGQTGIYVVGNKNVHTKYLYLILLILLIITNIVIGRKNGLFVGALTGVIFYISNVLRVRWKTLLLTATAGVGLLGIINLFRGVGVSEYGDQLDVIEIGKLLVSVLYSNEAYSAHFSLYGVLNFQIPVQPWVSFKNIILSLPPSSLGFERPESSYDLYSHGVNAPEVVGFTIHHAAAWYLNFGFAGIIAGAVVLGGIWVVLYNGNCKLLAKPMGRLYLFWAIAYSAFTAHLPSLLRAGPESYRGVFIVGIILPVLILKMCSIRKVQFH